MFRVNSRAVALTALVAGLACCGALAAPDAVGRVPFRAPLDVSRPGNVFDGDIFVDRNELYDFYIEFVQDTPESGSKQALAQFLGSGRTQRVTADSAGTDHPQVLQTQTPEEAEFLRSGGMLVGEEAPDRPGGAERTVEFLRDGVVVKTRRYRVPEWRVVYAPGGAGAAIPLRLVVREDGAATAKLDGVVDTQGAVGDLRAIAHVPLRRGTVHVHIETTTAQPIPPGWHSQLLVTFNPKIRPAEDARAP